MGPYLLLYPYHKVYFIPVSINMSPSQQKNNSHLFVVSELELHAQLGGQKRQINMS